MQTIKCLNENLIKTLSSIKDDNVSIFDVTIERRKLLETLKLLTADTLTINYGKVSWETRKKHEYGKEYVIDSKVDNEPCVQIVSDRFTMRFLNRAKERYGRDYKTIPINFIEKSESVKPDGTLIDIQEFIEALNYSLIAVAADNSRRNLDCILFESGNDTLKLVSADGFRLSIAPIKAVGITTDKILINHSEISRLLTFLKSLKPIGTGKNKNYPELYISYGDNLKFTSGNNAIELEITDRKITFPNYEALIPTQGYKTEFIASQLLQAVKSLNGMAKDGSGIIRLQFHQSAYFIGKITLSARSEELGESSVDCDANVETDGRIAFNGKYLIDFLKLCKDNKVSIKTTNESSTALFELDNKTHILMPMFVQWNDKKPEFPEPETVDQIEDETTQDEIDQTIEDTELVEAIA